MTSKQLEVEADEYQRIREAMGVPDDYEIAESDLAMALRHESRTGELPEFNGEAKRV